MLKKILILLAAIIVIVSAMIFTSVEGIKYDLKFSFSDEDNYFERVCYPYFTDTSYPLTMAMNNDIEADVKEVQSSMEKNIADSEGYGLPMEMQYISYYQLNEFKEITSVKTVNYTYTGGAHGYQYINSYTGTLGSDKLYKLGDIFKKEDDGISYIKRKILDMISEYPEKYFEDASEYVENSLIEYNYYINELGNVVVYFNPYEIAPYAAGICEFEVSYESMKDILKSDINSFLKDGEEEKFEVRKNGLGCEFENDFINRSGRIFIPARETCEKLGIDITWSSETGVVIGGINVSKSSEIIIENDKAYVPCDFFNTVNDKIMVYQDENSVVNIFVK